MPSIEKQTGIKLTYTDLFIKLAVLAIDEHPIVNTSWTEKGIRQWHTVNIGIATDVPGGLMVPFIRHAEKLSLAEIVASRSDLVQRGREGKLNLDEISGSTFTLNNVGALGIKCVDAIINPPESAILTIGGIIERPVVISGKIVIRPVAELSLGADHRIIDGASGSRFLHHFKELVENPEFSLPLSIS